MRFNTNNDTEAIDYDDDDDYLPEKVDKMKIKFDEEFRFLLYRHWTLFDSMYHSSYIGPRMSVWNMHGKEQLQTFLAFMG